jgi:hypothetical protein
MKQSMKLHVLSSAIIAIIFNSGTLATTTFDGRQFNTYKAEIIVQDGRYKCDLVNMEASSDFSIGVRDGGFNAVVKNGWTCNLDVFLNTANQIEVIGSSGPLNPINPYTTQRNGAVYGQMTNSNGTFTFMTERAGTAAIWLQPNSKLETSGNLNIVQKATNAHSLYVQGGEAIINGNLSIDRTRTAAQIDDSARALLVDNGGTLNVIGNLTTNHRMATNVDTSKGGGVAWDLNNGTIKIDGAGSIESNLNSHGIRATNSSKLDVGSDLTIIMTQYQGHSAKNGITSDGSMIDVGSKLNITGDEHVLIRQESKAVFNINGETILEKKTKGDYIQNDNSTINFEHKDISFIPGAVNPNLVSNGLVNTNNAHVYFKAADTMVAASALDNAIVNKNNATIHFVADKSTVNGNINNINRGIITLQNAKNGSELTINGNYVGADGILMMDVDLDDDNSGKDFVIINGKASGTTELQVNNINGLGSPTRHGIQIIQTNESEKGAFYIANKGYVSAGAHDYYLEYRQADTGGVNAGPFDNWYLMNYDYKDYIYTPDIGSYVAVETMGNTLFNSR